jgi:hypothetical protein
MLEFESFVDLYDKSDFQGILEDDRGSLFLKLRSISRGKLLKEFAKEIGADISDLSGRDAFRSLFESKVNEKQIEAFIKNVYNREFKIRKSEEDWLYSQLYKLKVFDWGGLYQNSLEQTIVNNYVKKIKDFDVLSKKIENELHASMRGYVLNSWYNHWSSILIEDIFKSHPKVLPSVGLVKKVDFFWKNFPFDLKVTHFPDGFMEMKRREKGWRPELSELKRFAKEHDVPFDKGADSKSIFSELLARITELKSKPSIDFMKEFHDQRKSIILESAKNPKELMIWLYEQQGLRRFDAANRFFLILVNLNNLEESWKLKRNKTLLQKEITEFLEDDKSEYKDMEISFDWQGKTYHTHSCALFIFAE